MKVKELLKMIEIVGFLSDDDKKYWSEAIPGMSKAQLEKLASVLSWAQDQKENATEMNKNAASVMVQIFEKMNDFACKKAKKSLLVYSEREEKKGEAAEQERILKELE